MPHDERYVIVPPQGVSLATSEYGVDPEFRERVMERAASSAWHKYVTVSALKPERRLVELLRLPFSEERLAVHRGAESALRAHVSLWGVARMWVPELSYPGYRRVASYLGIALVTYANLEDLGAVDRDDVVVLADPAVPLFLGELEDVVFVARARTSKVVIDATFSTLTPARLSRYVSVATSAECSLIISASKSLALAALRVAMIYVPKPHSIARVGTEWDVFQCAAVDVLLTDDALCRRASEVHKYQSDVLERLVPVLRAQALSPRDPLNELAVVVEDPNPSSARYGSSGWKSYPSHGLVRLDVSEHMVSAITEWSRS